jgi:NAD dependent epimerase/dehydratase family enzyme
MSLKGFSQNDTIPKPIVLTKPIARLVIKDLVTGDAANRELQAMQKILTITNDKLLTQSDLVLNLKTQVLNYQRIIEQKDGQFKSQEEMSKELQKALKKERRTKKLYQIGSAVGAAALLLKFVQ